MPSVNPALVWSHNSAAALRKIMGSLTVFIVAETVGMKIVRFFRSIEEVDFDRIAHLRPDYRPQYPQPHGLWLNGLECFVCVFDEACFFPARVASIKKGDCASIHQIAPRWRIIP